MIWPCARRAMPIIPELAQGYSLRTYHEGDVAPYIELLRRAGFSNWDAAKAQAVLDTVHANGLFFVIHDATQTLVATAAAQNKARQFHPAGGELGWVAADPQHRGKGLGYAVCAAATRRLIEAGHPTLYLLTDDFRLPAIRVYLRLGWIPFLYTAEMEERWRAVCFGLGIEFADLDVTTSPAGL